MDALIDEVESLEAILMDDVHITKNSQSGIPEVIETTIFPQVGEEAEQYVCVTLQVMPTPEYPEESPHFKLLRPRGLDDLRLEDIKKACNKKLQESIGFPVVFDLIEVVREHLTGSNLPSGQCVVCLYGFSDGDEFTRTECFHYLHSYCLGRHLNALRRTYKEEYDKLPSWLQKTAEPFQALCPVCREPIKDEEDSLRCSMPPSSLENAPEFKLTRELRDLQQRMSALFIKQKSKGAIIDVDAEGGTVISIETEEEMRRRLQSKSTYNSRNENAHTQSNSLSFEGNAGSNQSPHAGTSSSSEHKEPTCAKPSGSTNFAPVVQQTHRVSGDPTNNNYHHNRRHFRGGRRHQHHHHHHHRGERERDRDRASEHGGTSGGTNSNTTSSSSGKQAKAQMANSVHGR